MRTHARVHFVTQLVASFFAVSVASTALSQASVSGSGARGNVAQTTNFGGTTALLNAFDLNFGFGNDHHIRRVRVLPGEADGSVAISYHDKNGDDSFAYLASFHGLTNNAIIKNELSGVCNGSCTTTVAIPAGFTFVVRGFDTSFSSEDHQIKTIGVEHGGTTLRVYMADQNGDDGFSWKVRYALVPNTLIGARGNASGSGTGAAQSAITAGRTVIRGFMFHFTSADHHISRISVRPQGTLLKVAYNDKNADDGFSWRVQWANLR